MQKRSFLFIVCIILSNFTIAQIDSIHIPWQLDGANERIEEYRKGDISIKFKLPNGTIVSDEVPVNLELKKHQFHFGTSMTQTYGFYKEDNYESYLKRVKELFNYTTLGFYPGAIHKNEGKIKVPENVLNDLKWAKENNMSLRGHTLVWHNYMPTWLKNATNVFSVENSIKYNIRYVLEEFPEIKEWDVYNEAVAVNLNHVEESGVTRWVTHKGGVQPAVEYLFNFANKIAPDRKYINNHYTHSHQTFKDLNQYLVDKNIGLGAIGIQTHMHSESDFLEESEMWNFLEEYAVFGKKLHLSELTVASSVPFKDWREIQAFEAEILKARQQGLPTPFRPSTPTWEKFQADYLKDFYTLAFSHPAVETIVMWNTGDLNAWRGAAGGILDKNHQPKQAYNTLKKLIKEDWHTAIDKQTQNDGSVTFNGFYGKYAGTITVNNVTYQFSFTHSTKNTSIIIDLNPTSPID